MVVLATFSICIYKMKVAGLYTKGGAPPGPGILSFFVGCWCKKKVHAEAGGVPVVSALFPPLHCQSPQSSPLLALLAKSSCPIICITVRHNNFTITVTPIDWPATFVASLV
jgi:hypothetical protein